MSEALARMADFDLTDDQRLVRATVRDFAEKEILPHVETYELIPNADGCELRYTAARMVHPDDPERVYADMDAKIVDLYAAFFAGGFQTLAQMAAG